MKTTKKLLSLFLALAMCLSLLVGCSSSGTESSNAGSDTSDASDSGEETSLEEDSSSADAEDTDTDGDVVVLDGNYLRDKVTCSLSADAGSLDPYIVSQWGSDIAVLQLVYQHLANYDNEGNLHWALAKSFEEVDELTYTLTLWDNIYDSEGNHITSEDVVYSVEYYISQGNGGGVNCLDYLEIVDDYTLTWHCSKAFGDGDMAKNLSNFYIVSKTAYEASGEDMTTAPVGTGPYKLASYTAGSNIVLVANEDFWMKNLSEEDQAELWYYEAQNVYEIEFQVILDASSRAIALEMGTIDLADTLDFSDIEALEGNDEISAVDIPVTAPVAFYFNCSDNSSCASLALRQAICYAIDSDAVADGLSVPAEVANGLSPRLYDAPESWTTDRDYYDYDADKVAELLEEAGYNGETLTIMYSSTTAVDDAALIVQSQLSAAGINTELYCVEESIKNVEKYESDKWDILFETMGGGNYMSQVLKRFTSEDASSSLDGGQQIMFVVDDTLDALYAALAEDASEENANAWDEYFTYEQCYGYALCVYNNQTASRSDVNVAQGTKHASMPNAFTFND